MKNGKIYRLKNRYDMALNKPGKPIKFETVVNLDWAKDLSCEELKELRETIEKHINIVLFNKNRQI